MHHRPLSLVFAALAASACKGGGTGSSEVAAGVSLPLEQIDEAYREVVCRYQMECANTPYRDLAHCKANVNAAGLEDLLAGVRDGRVLYDAAAMGACRALIEKRICELPYFFSVPTVPEVVDDCLLNQGRQQAGQACRHELECARGLDCEPRGACGGTCKPFPRQGESCAKGSCAGGDDESLSLTGFLALYDRPDEFRRRQDEADAKRLHCEDNVCQPSSPIGGPCSTNSRCRQSLCDVTARVCKPFAALGGACKFGGLECGYTNWCDARSGGTPGVCRAPSGVGASCSLDNQCQDGLICRGEPTAVLRGSCQRGCQSSSDCSSGQGCDDAGVCVALPSAGGRCAAGGACAKGLACHQGLCVQPRFPGEPCTAAEVCLGTCRGGRCENRAPLGAACAQGGDCASNACQSARCVDGSLCK